GLGMARSRWSWSIRYSTSIRNRIRSFYRSHSRWQRLREQQVDEALGHRLRLVVGEPRTFVRLDEDVLGYLRRLDHEVDADHRDVDRAGDPAGRHHQIGMHLRGDVVDRSAGVQ